MPVEEGVNPLEERPVVSQQPDAGSDRGPIGPWPDVYVVVHLQVPDAEVLDKRTDDFVEMLPGARVTKVEMVAPLFHDPFALAHEEGLRREHLSNRAAHPDDLRLDPKSGHHAFGPDVVEHLCDAIGEPAFRGRPSAHGVPPALA